jgi:two-component system, NarL family, invasion response regulator UvrY
MGREQLSSPLKVLLVDDQLPFRLAARALLDAEDGYHVVGEAEDGEQAVELSGALRPELVLMDVRLPGLNGIATTRRILARYPSTMVVLVSTHREADLPPDLLACGALGFLRKETFGPAALDRLVHRR